MDKVNISVISITYNNLEGLKKTLQSYLLLDRTDTELVVVDGNSTDGTSDYLKNLPAQKSIRYISEKDKGIYDAMNKGIALAGGEWVIFMNAGDCFYSPGSLNAVSFRDEYDVLYGNCEVHYDNYKRFLHSDTPISQLWKGMFFSHQTVLVRSALIKANPFDLKYRFCADFNQLFTLFKQGCRFHYANTVISTIEAGGVSDSKRYLSTSEVFAINRKLNNGLLIYLYFPVKIAFGFLVVKLKKILPPGWKSFFLKLKYLKK